MNKTKERKPFYEMDIMESINHFEKKLKQGKDLDKGLAMLREEIQYTIRIHQLKLTTNE